MLRFEPGDAGTGGTFNAAMAAATGKQDRGVSENLRLKTHTSMRNSSRRVSVVRRRHSAGAALKVHAVPRLLPLQAILSVVH
jgi:hypothetical protein